MTCFDQAFAAVIGEEGGYSHNPADPGGETKYGISGRAHPTLDIKNLTLDQAKEIYRTGYWDVVRCDDLPPPLALLVFDSSVNNGPGAAARWLQMAAGVPQDGKVGPLTVEAVQRHGLAELLVEFQARRMLFQLTLPTVQTFGLGWARRLARMLLGSMALEGMVATPAPGSAAALAPTLAPAPPAPAIIVTSPSSEEATTEELNTESLHQAEAARPTK